MKLNTVRRSRPIPDVDIHKTTRPNSQTISGAAKRNQKAFQAHFLCVWEEAIVEDSVAIGWLLGLGRSLMFFSADPRLVKLDGERFLDSKSAKTAIASALETARKVNR